MTSEPEKLLPVIQADREAAASLLIQHCTMSAQMAVHGDSDGSDYVQAFARHRLSSPVSGTDMVLVLAEPTDAMLHYLSSSEDPRMTYAALLAAAPASPSTPIPVIAEAGEQEAVKLIDRLTDLAFTAKRAVDESSGLADHKLLILANYGDLALQMAPAFRAALFTPATLDNTAVEGQPARVYLASRFSRRHECHALAQVLKAAGHSIASEWVQADQESVPVVGPSDTAAPEYREYWGKLDLQNVRDCDWLISLQEPERSGGRGGRHVEFGIAAALNKRLTIIGPRETVFHHLPNVEHFDTVEAFVATLTAKTD